MSWQAQWYKERHKHQAQIVSEWRANKRLQLITLISCALFVVWSMVQLESWRSANEASARAAFAKLEDIKIATGEKNWPQRAAQAKKQLASLRGKLWQAQNEGEAQAGLRDWIELQARTHGVAIDAISVDVGRVQQNVGLHPVRAELKGQYSVGAWQKFMRTLATTKPAVIVEYDELSFARAKKPAYRISVIAWFELQDKGGA
ncbi:MAG: hypothetical protein ACJA0N_000060 [Pseudohongiellaceae bacterium]|jgi:hypothetical protein